MANRYLIAQYVANLARMEPRNIGIILWANGVVESRFLAAKDAPFVRYPAIYTRWVKFWKEQLSRDEIQPIKCAAVPRHSLEFLDALLKTQEGNYRLFDGGFVCEDLRDAAEAADFLFGELVLPAGVTRR